jgi:Indole-3-glycerol phosphate synthase
MNSFRPIAVGYLVFTLTMLTYTTKTTGFTPVVQPTLTSSAGRGSSTSSLSSPKYTTTSLNAIGVLARKAKENEIRQYCQEGIDDSVLQKVQEMKQNLPCLPSVQEADQAGPGPVQLGLTKRKGTISIIAEYKRTFIVKSGFANEVFEPHIMSPVFREFGARGVAILADQRMGGCDYEDMAQIVKEQEGARGDMPGPVPVISSDLIVDEVQIARSAAVGAQSVLLSYDVVGDKLEFFLNCARAVGMEAIVAVSTKDEAQRAIDVGARMISVTGLDDVEEKVAVITGLVIPEGAQVCTIANILANDNKALEEVEEAWVCRDKGFNCVWVSDCLYKSGNDPAEHAGAIIRSMGAKSSVKWASAKAMGGKGEGAREYLGDILM